jgi:hypothetical protein
VGVQPVRFTRACAPNATNSRSRKPGPFTASCCNTQYCQTGLSILQGRARCNVHTSCNAYLRGRANFPNPCFTSMCIILSAALQYAKFRSTDVPTPRSRHIQLTVHAGYSMIIQPEAIPPCVCEPYSIAILGASIATSPSERLDALESPASLVGALVSVHNAIPIFEAPSCRLFGSTPYLLSTLMTSYRSIGYR